MTDLLHLLPMSSFKRALVLGCTENIIFERLRNTIESLKIVEDEKTQKLKDNSFDLICYFPDHAFSARQVREAHRLLTPGGAIFIVLVLKSDHGRTGKRNQIKEIRNELIIRNFLEVCVYGLSPSLDDIRLAVPIAGKRLTAASLALYQPSLRKAKLRKLLAYFLGLSGFSTFWAPDKVLVARKAGGNKPESLQAFLGKLYGMEVNVALFTGTPGYLRKPSIQIMNTTGSILGYGKIGDKPSIRKIIENEAQTLSRLKNLDLGEADVPEVKYLGGIHSDAIFFIQSTCKGHLSSAPLTPQTIHADFLFRLFNQTKIVTDFEKSTCLKEVSARLQSIDRKISEDWSILLARALRWCSGKIGRCKLPLGLAHLDFTPWNTFLSNGRLFIFDWEFAREAWIPLYDAFHFIIQKGVLVDKENKDKQLKKLFSKNSKEGSFIYGLSLRLGIGKTLILPLLVFYLCDIATIYINNYLRHGVLEIEVSNLLSCWKGMLRDVLYLGV